MLYCFHRARESTDYTVLTHIGVCKTKINIRYPRMYISIYEIQLHCGYQYTWQVFILAIINDPVEIILVKNLTNCTNTILQIYSGFNRIHRCG